MKTRDNFSEWQTDFMIMYILDNSNNDLYLFYYVSISLHLNSNLIREGDRDELDSYF